MKLPYPQSVNCSFDNFPPALDVRMGKSANEIVASSSWGSKFVLNQTPKSGILQGEYSAGSTIPDLAWIYSDTGSDDDYSLKISFIGHGSFYKLTSSSAFLRAQVYKAIIIENPDTGQKIFGDTFDCETLIPAGTDAAALFSYDWPIVQYVDQASTGEGSSTVVINGQTYNLSDGTSITMTSATGGTVTYTLVGGVLVIS